MFYLRAFHPRDPCQFHPYHKHFLSFSIRRNMSTYITTHNADGKAIFSEKLPTEQHEMAITLGTIKTIWSSHECPMNLSTEADIEQYKHDRTSPFFSGGRRICPDNGSSIIIMNMKPGGVESSVSHRTMTLDVVLVLEGEIECHLDSGEKRTAQVGDVIVQRGTMHKWVNVTPNSGWAKWVGLIQAATEPIKVVDKELGAEWAH
jgi:quercetin dioxygenase-like cupin family protein